MTGIGGEGAFSQMKWLNFLKESAINFLKEISSSPNGTKLSSIGFVIDFFHGGFPRGASESLRGAIRSKVLL
jgi:hypothetical protein